MYIYVDYDNYLALKILQLPDFRLYKITDLDEIAIRLSIFVHTIYT